MWPVGQGDQCFEVQQPKAGAVVSGFAGELASPLQLAKPLLPTVNIQPAHMEQARPEQRIVVGSSCNRPLLGECDHLVHQPAMRQSEGAGIPKGCEGGQQIARLLGEVELQTHAHRPR